jgi:hypothetical protein
MSKGPLFPIRPRGAAAVEMAISMLVLVPVFLYALFLDDLLRYSLDAQETALSTVWDYTVQDYSAKFNPWNAQHLARLMFCDHESGIDSYEKMPSGKYRDCEETDHHKALVAHVCWINDNAKQVECHASGGVGDLGDSLNSGYRSAFTQGGLMRCSARAVVENYLLPKQFLTQFTEENLSKNQWKGQGQKIHDNSRDGTRDNAYFLKQQQLAILVDTWALTRAEDERPGGTSKGSSAPPRSLRSMVEYVYTKNTGFKALEGAAKGFFGQAALVLERDSARTDEPTRPNLAISPYRGAPPTEKIRQEKGDASYFNTEWEDWEKNHTRRTYERRKAGYLGCAPGVGC